MATLTLPDSLFDRLQTLAAQNQLSVETLIEQSLDDCMDKPEPATETAPSLYERLYPHPTA